VSSHVNHADALRTLLIADGDPRPRFEASELATCAECARIVAEHRRLLDELERLGGDERASLAAARSIATAPGRAEAALRQRILDDVARAPAPERRRRRWIATALAAAAFVAIAFVALRWRAAHPADDDHVLGGTARLLHPRGSVESFAPFRWNVELPAGGHFVVHVDGQGVDLDSPWLTAQEWTPDDTSKWPAKIRWRLEVYRASGPGDLVASYVEWAER
jgi:hypothetical protein